MNLCNMKCNCTVYVDGERLNNGKMLLCTVACGKYVGGAYCCAPRSRNDDGLLEVCLVHPVSHIRFMSLISSYTEGTHLDNPKLDRFLEYRRGKSIHVEAPEGFIYSLDGELIEGNDFTVEVVPRAIRFAVPKGARPLVAAEPAKERESLPV